MKLSLRRAAAWLILTAVFVVPVMAGCARKKTPSLPPVVTKGIPENDAVRSTIVFEGFTIDIHSTYAEIKGYTGTETDLTIPESAAGIQVRLIGEKAFQNNVSLTRVKLPSGLLTIDRFAFEGCTALREVVFNDGLETVGDYAFRNSGLQVLALPDSVAGIGKYSFYCSEIETLTIPASVSRLGKYAFYGCQHLIKIEFCPRLEEIGERVFYNCTSLTTLVIPKTVLKIDNYAFSSCTSLGVILIPAETEKIGEGAFQDCPCLTIFAPAGSAAEKAAARNRYAFEAVDYDAFAFGNHIEVTMGS